MVIAAPRWMRLGALVGLGLVAAAPGHGAGFSIFEQGSKAMGMAGAFTAQADDPSALFHNAAGLAFQDKRGFQLGFTYITFAEAKFQGADPFPGSDARGEQKKLQQFPPQPQQVPPRPEQAPHGQHVAQSWQEQGRPQGDDWQRFAVRLQAEQSPASGISVPGAATHSQTEGEDRPQRGQGAARDGRGGGDNGQLAR